MKTFEETTYIEHVEHHINNFHLMEREYLSNIIMALDTEDEVHLAMEIFNFKELLVELKFQRLEIMGHTDNPELVAKFDAVLNSYNSSKVYLDIPMAHELKVNPLLPPR